MSQYNWTNKTKTQCIHQAHRIDSQRKYAWANYYNEANAMVGGNYAQVRRLTRIVENDSIPTMVLNELKELLAETKKKIECPICLESIHPKLPAEGEGEGEEDPKILKISPCGHKYCEECWLTLSLTTKTCAICRRKWR
jgi:hypothetical protein